MSLCKCVSSFLTWNKIKITKFILHSLQKKCQANVDWYRWHISKNLTLNCIFICIHARLNELKNDFIRSTQYNVAVLWIGNKNQSQLIQTMKIFKNISTLNQLQFYNSGVMLSICHSAFYDLVCIDQNVIKMRTLTQQNSARRMTVHLNYYWSNVSVDFVLFSYLARVDCHSTQSIYILMQHFLLFQHSNITEVNASPAVYIYNSFSKMK